MFTCALHNWFSNESPCPACPTFTTSRTDIIINQSDHETLTNTVDGSVEDAAKKYLDQMAYNGAWETEQMIEMFIAGASTNQQRKCQDACDWPDCTLKGCVVKGGQHGGDAQLLLDMVTEYINLEKVVSDKKAYKKFESIVDKVFSGYYAQSTPTPPGIVEQLRKDNPYSEDKGAQNRNLFRSHVWNQCCDTLTTLLSEKGENAIATNIPDGEGDWVIGQETYSRQEVLKMLFTQRAMISNDVKRTGVYEKLPEIVALILENPRTPLI